MFFVNSEETKGNPMTRIAGLSIAVVQMRPKPGDISANAADANSPLK